MKFWFTYQDLHQTSTLINYTLVKSEIKKQQQSLQLAKNVEDLVSRDYPDNQI